MKTLGTIAPEQRRARGAELNTLKDAVTAALEAKKDGLASGALAAAVAAERIDVTLPVRPEPDGRIHPISQTIDEMIAILGEMGFAVAEGPHIEDDFHNFTALNIPPEHPARQVHDTFYLPPARRRHAARAAHPHLAGAGAHDAERRSRRSASSRPAAPTAPTTTRRTRRCSTRSRGW